MQQLEAPNDRQVEYSLREQQCPAPDIPAGDGRLHEESGAWQEEGETRVLIGGGELGCCAVHGALQPALLRDRGVGRGAHGRVICSAIAGGNAWAPPNGLPTVAVEGW